MPKHLTFGDTVVIWIARYCVEPDGPRRSQPAELTVEQAQLVLQIYDAPGGPAPVPVTGSLAAFLILFHLAGPIARKQRQPPPREYSVDIFTLWSCVGRELRSVLVRRGTQVCCPELGTAVRAA